MNVVHPLWASVKESPTMMRHLHGYLAVLWFIAAFPIMIFWSENIRFLVFVSVYAVVVGHWSSWQAARVEERQEQAEGGA